MKLKDFLILSFIAAAIIGVAISYQKVYLFHFMGVLIFIYFGLKVLKNRLVIRYDKLPTRYHYLFYFMFIWYLLSIVWSLYKPYSIIYMVYIISGTFLSLTTVYYVRNRETQQKVFKVASIVFIALIFISFLEIYTSFRLPHSPYPSSYGIASGFFGNQNNLATTMSIIFPFFLFHHKLIIKYFGCISILLVVFIAGSRANILALVFMTIIYFVAYRKNISFSKLIKGIVAFIVFILCFGIYTQFYDIKIVTSDALISSYSALERYTNLKNIQGEDSVGIRQQLIVNGLKALKDSYGIGVGGGASIYVQEQYSSTRNIASMHNFWVELLVEGGVIFFAVFIIWYISLIKKLYSIAWKSKNENYFASATSLSLIGFVPAAVSASSVIYLLPMWLLYGFAVSVVNVSKISSKKKS